VGVLLCIELLRALLRAELHVNSVDISMGERLQPRNLADELASDVVHLLAVAGGSSPRGMVILRHVSYFPLSRPAIEGDETPLACE